MGSLGEGNSEDLSNPARRDSEPAGDRRQLPAAAVPCREHCGTPQLRVRRGQMVVAVAGECADPLAEFHRVGNRS
jgi:hypothetical protein